MRLLRRSLVCLILLPLLARAETVLPAVPDVGTSVLQMFLGLALVLAMLVGGLWLLKRLTLPRGATAGLLRVIAGTAVGPRERVVLLEIGSTWLVLGVAQGRVSILAEVPRQDIALGHTDAEGKDFATWLKQIVDRRHGSST